MAGIEDILGKHGNHHMRDKFKRFDNRFIRPFLLRNYQVRIATYFCGHIPPKGS